MNTIKIELEIECADCGQGLICEYIESLDIIQVKPCSDCMNRIIKTFKPTAPYENKK